MPTSKRRRESPASDKDQPPLKRHAEEPKEQPPQDGDFQIQVKVKEHCEFDWIEFVTGFIKPKQDHKDTDTQSNADTGSTSEDSEEKFYDDLEDFDECSGSDLNEDAIGRCDALLMDSYRTNFYQDMEEPSAETSELAFELFDRYGRLKSEFKDHPIKKGSGIWKDELDHGPILLIENFSIYKPYRRRGWGKKMINAVLEETISQCGPFIALTQPGGITRDYDKLKKSLTDEEGNWFFAEQLRVATAFWRSAGFRRIGSSPWFGRASKLDHPCHNLAAAEDYDPPVPQYRPHYSAMGSLLAEIAVMEDKMAVKRVKEAFQNAPIPTNRPSDAIMESLFTDISTKDDDECVEKLQQVFEHLPINDSRYEARDDYGNTVLHIAAINFKPKCVKWIMERNTLLVSSRNMEQETPLEAIKSHLEIQRTRRGSSYLISMVPVSDEFEGFAKEMVACICILDSQIDLSTVTLQQLTFGCTCGQCIGGFLSPRMCLAILCQAENNHDILDDEFEDMSGDEFVECNKYALRYVPHLVRENMKTNKSMRAGFANLCNHFAKCLRSDNLPTTTNVLCALQNAREWPPTSRNFLQRGGNVESVGSMLFEAARQQDEVAGDGSHLAVFRDKVEVLPECRNDHEFGFVSGMCGYERVFPTYG